MQIQYNLHNLVTIFSDVGVTDMTVWWLGETQPLCTVLVLKIRLLRTNLSKSASLIIALFKLFDIVPDSSKQLLRWVPGQVAFPRELDGCTTYYRGNQCRIMHAV
jgi:hypothetical protein